jgi:hypothetical protein
MHAYIPLHIGAYIFCCNDQIIFLRQFFRIKQANFPIITTAQKEEFIKNSFTQRKLLIQQKI